MHLNSAYIIIALQAVIRQLRGHERKCKQIPYSSCLYLLSINYFKKCLCAQIQPSHDILAESKIVAAPLKGPFRILNYMSQFS